MAKKKLELKGLKMKYLILFFISLPWVAYPSSEDVSSREKKNASLVRTIGKKEIKGVELVWVSKAYGSLSTSFGHAFIRLVDTTPSWQDDLTISAGLEDDVETMKQALGAITGDYPLDILYLSFGRKWHQYVISERRHLRRFVLATNQEIRDNLKANLIKILLGQDSPGNYKFFSNNCISFLIDVLKGSGIPLASQTLTVPSDLDQYLFESGALFFPPSAFVFPEEFIRFPDHFSDEFISAMAESWEEEELKRFLIFFSSKLKLGQIRFLKKERGLQISSHEELFLQGYEEIPPSFYELCVTEGCLEEKRAYLGQRYPKFLTRGYPFLALKSDPSSPMGVGYVPIDMDETEWSEAYRLNARMLY